MVTTPIPQGDNPYDQCGTCIHQIQHHDAEGCTRCDCDQPTGER